MSSGATDPLLSTQLAEQRIEFEGVRSLVAPGDEERSQAAQKKWVPRQLVLFVIAVSVISWGVIVFGVRQLF